jgi:hypothetical protein
VVGLAGAQGGHSVRGRQHLGTLIVAIVVGPLAWVMLAFGQDRSAEAFANASVSGAFNTEVFVRPLLSPTVLVDGVDVMAGRRVCAAMTGCSASRPTSSPA